MTKYDPQKHHRRSIRLKGYDYSQAGAYFVTIVTHGRELLFDDPVLRRVAETLWQRIPRHFSHVELDAWVVMPDHIHGIIVITTTLPSGDKTAPAERPTGPPSGSLGAIIGNFKSITARRINRLRKTPGKPIWQRNYYEHIIRDERALKAIRQYIHDNPARWIEDTKSPKATARRTNR